MVELTEVILLHSKYYQIILRHPWTGITAPSGATVPTLGNPDIEGCLCGNTRLFYVGPRIICQQSELSTSYNLITERRGGEMEREGGEGRREREGYPRGMQERKSTASEIKETTKSFETPGSGF